MPKITKIRALAITDPGELDRRVKRALDDNQGNIERTAADLGIHWTTLHRVLRDRVSLRKYAAKKRVDSERA